VPPGLTVGRFAQEVCAATFNERSTRVKHNCRFKERVVQFSKESNAYYKYVYDVKLILTIKFAIKEMSSNYEDIKIINYESVFYFLFIFAIFYKIFITRQILLHKSLHWWKFKEIESHTLFESLDLVKRKK